MKKYLFLILFAVIAIIALLLYKEHLDNTYFPENTSVITEETTVIEAAKTTASEPETLPQSTVTAETSSAAKTTIVIEEKTTAIEEKTTIMADTKTEVESKPEKIPPKENEGINSLLDLLDIEYPENAMAVLINAPDEDVLKAAGDFGRFTSSKGEPPSLIIPVYIGSTLSVNEISGITNDGEFIFGERLVTDPDIMDAYSLLFEAIRPEGLPSYAIEITFEDKTALYAYAYDGKDGNEGIEYILIKEAIEPLG